MGFFTRLFFKEESVDLDHVALIGRLRGRIEDLLVENENLSRDRFVLMEKANQAESICANTIENLTDAVKVFEEISTIGASSTNGTAKRLGKIAAQAAISIRGPSA